MKYDGWIARALVLLALLGTALLAGCSALAQGRAPLEVTVLDTNDVQGFTEQAT